MNNNNSNRADNNLDNLPPLTPHPLRSSDAEDKRNNYSAANGQNASDIIQANAALINTLTTFVDEQIDRLEAKKRFVKGAADKTVLYNQQKMSLSNLGKSLDKQTELTNIIKQLALISHHHRYTKWDTAAKISTFWLSHKEADSWKAWKKLSIDDSNPYAAVYNQTLQKKSYRAVDNNLKQIVADNYNDYRDIMLHRFKKS